MWSCFLKTFPLESLICVSLYTQAYIHTRMRAKTSDFLKVLNRARPDAEKKEMKTISWVLSVCVWGLTPSDWNEACHSMV